MVQRIAFASIIAFFSTDVATAQIVRFETNAGDFDLVLNPTNHPQLRRHVDNMLHYVLSGRYDGTVINRADEGFVLQMGSYKVLNPEVPAAISSFIPIEPFSPVAGVPASNIGLSNTNGTVGLAVGGFPLNRDGGTSSFYINLMNSSFLDSDFTVFAKVAGMAPIHAIMALPQIDLTDDPAFGASPGHLGFTDVPLLPNGDLVVITRAFVVPEPAVAFMLIWWFAICASYRRKRIAAKFRPI